MEHKSPTIYEGNYEAPKSGRFAIVASRFNEFIVDRLLDGALDGFRRHGVSGDRLAVVRAPGSFELPLLCQRLANSGRFSAIVALGAVIRGSTTHYDLVAGEVAKGCAQAMLGAGVPVIFGVITCDTIEQAVERAGTKHGNKGWEAALSAIEMASLGAVLTEHKL